MPRTRFTRRPAAAAIAAGLTLVLAACGGGGSTSTATDGLDPNADLSKQSLNITIWDGHGPEDLSKRTKDRLGFDTKVAVHDTNETAMAKLAANNGGGIDVAFVSGQYAQALNEQGLLAPIHPELVPNIANLYPEASQLTFDKGNRFSVPYTWGTTGICYRSDLVRTPPRSWNDILTPPANLKGRVTMMATGRWLALPALKSLGFSLNTTDDQQIAQARELLLKARSSLPAFDDTTFGAKLAKGEAAMAVAWDGRCPTANPKIKFQVPKEGSDLWATTMVVMKSSRNKEAAHAFINLVLDPAIHRWVVENSHLKVPSKAAMDLVAKNKTLLEKNTPLQMTAAELLQGESIIDLGGASAKYTRLSAEVAAER